MAPRIEEVAARPRCPGSTSPASPSRSCSTARCCCTRSRTRCMARGYGFPVISINLHFLGGVTEIEGEAATPRRVRDRRRRPAHVARGRRRGGRPLVLVTPDGLLRIAVERPRRRQPARRRPQPGAGPAARRRPGPQGRASGASPATRTGARSSPPGAAGSPPSRCSLWPLLIRRALRLRARPLRLRARVHDRAVPLVRRDRTPSASARCARGCPALVARDLARRTLAVPADLPLAEAIRRAQEAEAGGIVTVTSGGAPVGRRQRGGRPRHARRPSAVGAVVDRRPDARRRACRCRPTSPARRCAGDEPDAGDGVPAGGAGRLDLRRARRPRTSTGVPRATGALSLQGGAAGCRACSTTSPRGLVGRAPRAAARGRVGPADRHQGPPAQRLPRGRASGSSPTGATSSTTS